MSEYLVAKVSDIGEGKMKEVVLGDSGNKVLLSKINGQINATSHKCTHYGAPLVKGVLSSDGRIVCPWHGACFNASTGDIEDAPALYNLFKFKVITKEENIYVEAEEQALKSGKRAPICKKAISATNTDTVLIVGGGASGNAAAEKLREDGFTGRVLIYSRESYLPIDRPKLSKSLELTAEKVAIRNDSFYNDLGISFHLGITATAVDTKSKIVIFDNGEKVKFDHLIIATGANPRSIPIPGIDLNNVFYLRTVQDNAKIKQAIGTSENEKKNLVIIGSSFIGMEVASVVAKKANVSVIGMEKVPFERILGEKLGAVVKKLHENNGIKFYLNADVNNIESSTVDSNTVGAVVLSDGTKISADLVVVGAGVAPSTDFLKSSPEFPLERDGSLRVNEYFKVEGLDNIYAIGDIASYPYHLTGETLRIEHWSYAKNTGRAVASVIAKNELAPFQKIPFFWSTQYGKGLRYAGYATSFDDVIIHGNLDEFSFAAYYARGEKIIAVATMAKDPIAAHSAELLRLGKFPTTSEIRDGKNPLDVPLSN
ncbi:10653_t:CDS:10 [Ambispora gerdemannii]|uniref:10653_t:CDS:1 n=1 Tax=Ambispora gerdemannii TaxID=144530 RepID=A0A9N9GS29_9GLOM|nr:10653_t:CDS:10 [Ambispora gerdemannii]